MGPLEYHVLSAILHSRRSRGNRDTEEEAGFLSQQMRGRNTGRRPGPGGRVRARQLDSSFVR